MNIRLMRESDLEFCVGCFKSEGWISETAQVIRGFLLFDPKGCLIGEENGLRVGMCVGVSYGECGFIGELIVVKKNRGQGFGRQLIERCINYLRSCGCRSIYLDGDYPAVRLYEKLGFRHVCKSLRFYGQVSKKNHGHVRPLTSSDIEIISSIDREAFGADRRFFLQYRLRLFPNLCKVLFTRERNLGFCMAQPGQGVVTIGPWLVGEGVERPIDLIESIAAEVGEMKLRLGILETNSRALQEIQKIKSLTKKKPSWRMVLGPDVGLGNSETLYSIGSASKG
jgi:ribosomal protein S18 acetylase RimI-like enzyme